VVDCRDGKLPSSKHDCVHVFLQQALSLHRKFNFFSDDWLGAPFLIQQI
jgi:hypothetical protein